jgi:hypothetical protein
MAFRYRQEEHFIWQRRPYLVWSCYVMGSFSVFTGAVYLLVFHSLSHRPPHPEIDSVGAVPLLYSISVQYHAWLRMKTLIWTTGAGNTTHKNTENNGPTQAETASGICPTNLRISAGSSRMKTTKLSYFKVTSRKFVSGPKNILTSWWRCHLNKFQVEIEDGSIK